jgi:hypothetical protein
VLLGHGVGRHAGLQHERGCAFAASALPVWGVLVPGPGCPGMQVWSVLALVCVLLCMWGG